MTIILNIMPTDILTNIDHLINLDKQTPESVLDQKKKDALSSLSFLHAALCGSVGWAIQTGIPVDQALKRTWDVDAIPLPGKKTSSSDMFNYDLDSAKIVSPGWEERVFSQEIVVDNQPLEIKIVDYHDIAMNICYFLSTDPYEKFQPHTVQKLLRQVAALVYMYNFS